MGNASDAEQPDGEQQIVLTARAEKVCDQFEVMTPEERVNLLFVLSATYCVVSGHELDEDGDCPEGCDPDELEEEDDLDLDSGDLPDDDDDDEGEEEPS